MRPRRAIDDVSVRLGEVLGVTSRTAPHLSPLQDAPEVKDNSGDSIRASSGMQATEISGE